MLEDQKKGNRLLYNHIVGIAASTIDYLYSNVFPYQYNEIVDTIEYLKSSLITPTELPNNINQLHNAINYWLNPRQHI